MNISDIAFITVVITALGLAAYAIWQNILASRLQEREVENLLKLNKVLDRHESETERLNNLLIKHKAEENKAKEACVTYEKQIRNMRFRRVSNHSKHPNAKGSYIQCIQPDGTAYLFTDHALDEAKARAEKNPEDIVRRL